MNNITPDSQHSWNTAFGWVEERLPGLPSTPQGFNKSVAKVANEFQKRPNKGKGGGFEIHWSALPQAAQIALIKKHPEIIVTEQLNKPSTAFQESSSQNTDSEDLWDHLSRKSEKARALGAKRLEAVKMFKMLIFYSWKKTEAKKEVVRLFKSDIKISFHTLGRWIKRVDGVDACDWLPLLVDGYAGRQAKAEISPEAWDFIKADYLRRCRPNWSSSYERLKRAAVKNGWAIPSSKTLFRKLGKEIHPDLIIILRDGDDAYKKTIPAQERDHTVFHALEAVNGDGYTFFKYVRFESGEICRPVCWFWQDILSGKLLSSRLDVSENKDSIRLSIGDLVEHFGIPSHFWIDNTRAAANKDVTGGVKNRYRFKVSQDEPLGLIPQLGAEVHWATPGHGQAKPVERAFGIGGIGEYTDKHPKFEGRGTKENPIPVDEFETVLTSEIAAFNARLGRRSKVCNGRSCDDVFNESYARSTIRKATREQRALWLLAPETVRTNRDNGAIKIMNNRYWCEALSHYKGQKLVARFDPANMHGNVIIYTLDGRRIGEAECIVPAGFNNREAGREVAKQNKRKRKHLREAENAELRISAREAANMLPELEAPDPPETKVIEPIFKDAQQKRKTIDGDDRFDRAVAMMKPAKESLL